MGTFKRRAPRIRWVSNFGVVGAVVVVLALACNSDSRKVSPKLFIAPFTQPPTASSQGGIIVRADKLDFLREIRPDLLDSELEDVPATAFVVGRLSSSDTDQATGKSTLSDDLLVFESQSRSLLSVNLCPDASRATCGQVRLNYSKAGLDEAQGGGGVISSDVKPLQLKNGWLLAFDSSSKNILGFREERPRPVSDDIDGDGTEETRLVPYRSPVRANGTVNTDSKNFGRGNGLFLSVVISGEELADQLSLPTEPVVSRMVEIEENKILLFFTTGTIVRAVHLLEVAEEPVTVDFDLDEPLRPSERLEVQQLRGQIHLFPDAFLTYRRISETVTGSQDLQIDVFQPVVIPDPSHDDPDPGLVLAYDSLSSNFFVIGVGRNPAGEILGGTVGNAMRQSDLIDVLQNEAGATSVSLPLVVRSGFSRVNEKGKAEVVFYEEKSRTILQYDPKAPIGDNVRVFVDSAALLFRRDPRGKPVTGQSNPVLDFATDDVNLNRLAFEESLDQLVSISYTSGVVVVVADVDEIGLATNDTLAEINYIEPLDDKNVRAFDQRSTSLVEFKLEYAAFPVNVD
ncbi:MAG TPA: hypothetical protein VFD71_14025 [Planctomycetota bacterium]|nr:hypothetical protein [Planctomycetota bacterium]